LKTILLTAGFGRRNFEQAAKRLATNAEKSGLFDKVLIENNHSLNKVHSSFINLHKEFLYNDQNRRGFGHYLWKPYIIDYWLERISEKDVLVFLDAGCHINHKNPIARHRFFDYLRIASEHDGLAMQIRDNSFGYKDLTEQRWTRLDLMEHLNVSKEIRTSNQIQSGIIFLKKGEKTLSYTSAWLKLATYDGCLFLDDSRIVPDGTLIESRWEQSIHSLLFKKYKFGILQDETTFGEQWPPNWNILGKNFPIWAMRHRSGVDPTKFRLNELGMRILDRLSK
jgi:hypothetical protein